MASTHHWKRRLTEIWQQWEPELERAARTDQEPQLTFSQMRSDPPPRKPPKNLWVWVEHSSSWVCKQRGLGDFPRFALARYLRLLPLRKRAFNPETDLADLGAMEKKRWLAAIAKVNPMYAERVKQNLSAFDTQCRAQMSEAGYTPQEAAARLSTLMDKLEYWEALASAANTRMRQRKQKKKMVVTALGLRDRRFAGPSAIADYLTYLNSGIVPLRQARYADDLKDLGVYSADSSGAFVHFVPYFATEERRLALNKLVLRAVRPSKMAMVRVSCLWSRVEPHGLIAACGQLVKQYIEKCESTECRRLPVVYVPIGLDVKGPRVIRRTVVRDLHKKLCVNRPGPDPVAELAKEATGEEVDKALNDIRHALSICPTFLIFGILHVEPDEVLRPILDEVLNNPLPWILDRLMPETGIPGEGKGLIPLSDASASRALVLADGPLTAFSTLEPRSVELPGCSSRAFPELLEWTRCPAVTKLSSNRHSIASNEIELSVLESLLALADANDGMPADARTVEKATNLLWGEQAMAAGPDRIAALLGIVLDHICGHAETNETCAWFATILQVIALSPGGLRRETIARVLARYLVATGSSQSNARPAWQTAREAVLWQPVSSNTRLTDVEVAELCQLVAAQLRKFENQAGGHIRRLEHSMFPGLDQYSHDFESPEVPEFSFQLDDARRVVIELRYPLVQVELRKQFEQRCSQKHALLQRILSEEFIRRAVIVQRHMTRRDELSLVEKRYVISAVFHGLDSLKHDRDDLLSEEGKPRASWWMEPSDVTPAYYWLYRWLYVEQINDGSQALSRQHGAEHLKIALLKLFLRAEPEPKLLLKRSSSRMLMVRSEILLGLAHAGLLSCNHTEAIAAMDQLDALNRRGWAALRKPEIWAVADMRQSYLRTLSQAQLEATTLRLDGAVMYGQASPNPAFGFDGRHLRQQLWRTLNGIMAEMSNGRVLVAMLKRMRAAVFAARGEAPPFKSLVETGLSMRRALPARAAQIVYDWLIRHAELVVNLAEHLQDQRRFMRQRRALLLFELAEVLRKGASGSEESEHVLKLRARPVRNACRLCLTMANALRADPQLGKTPRAEPIDMSWLFERAAYYSVHFIGNNTKFHLERIAGLIIEASIIRIRGRVADRAQLNVAMSVMKSAELALVHRPARVQLWMRFYLERARLFRDIAVDPRTKHADAMGCAAYCVSDVKSILRLAKNRDPHNKDSKRDLWIARAKRVRDSVPRRLLKAVSKSVPSPSRLPPRPVAIQPRPSI